MTSSVCMFFEVKLLISRSAMKSSPVDDKPTRVESHPYKIHSVFPTRRKRAHNPFLFTLRVKEQTNKEINIKKTTAAFLQQKRPLFSTDCRAAARCSSRLLTLVGSYDVRIGWVSSSELKHCRKHSTTSVCTPTFFSPLSVHEYRGCERRIFQI